MKNNNGSHLSEKRIIESLIDMNDLDLSEQGHLKDCPVCSAARDSLQARLDGLSREAARWTPTPGRRFALPAREIQKTIPWARRWYVGLATAAAGLALIITFAWPYWNAVNIHPYGKLDLARETAADETFMAATRDLVENSLPASLQGVVPDTGSADDNYGDYLDFFAPEEV